MPDATDWIVIPTFNERANVGPLLTAIRRVYTGQILFVDDSSPDGTGLAVQQLAAHDPGIHLLTRPRKQGLAAAYREGLTRALQQGAQRILHMDADRSHDPRAIPELLSELSRADVVVGSRYVAGGTLDIPFHRRVISAIGNQYIQLLLGRNVHDWSSGCCAWRAPMLARALTAATTTVGYAWLIEMKWRAKQAGARMAEVPLRFTDRTEGESKFSWQIMAEDLRTAWRLHRGR